MVPVCELKVIKRDLVIANVQTTFTQFPIPNITLNVQLKKRGNALNPIIYNFNIDVCAFMEQQEKYPLARLFYVLLGLDRYSNLNHSCPFNHDIMVTGYRVDEQILAKIPMPYGDYGLVLLWNMRRQVMLKNEIAFKFFEKISYGN